MSLTDARLTELVAELRERLRHFAAGPPGEAQPSRPPGPLEPAGRAALAARLLAVVVGARQGKDAVAATAAFENLAAALEAAPSPLPGSAWEADLALLAREFETLAGAWDRADDPVLVATWSALRTVGDRLWSGSPEVAAATPPNGTRAESPVPRPVNRPTSAREGKATDKASVAEVWLLVAGSLHRDSLRRRLRAAGLRVDCPEDIEAVTRRLAAERPAALICDDAAPARFRSRLIGKLPESAPPLILVRRRTGAVDPAASVWLPPYDTDEILARIG